MTGISWWFVDSLSKALESGEREVVYGDLVEASESGVHALRQVLGLVVRRQLEAWRGGRPWLVLAGLVVPLGFLLSLVSIRVAGAGSVYSWMYFNNSDWALFQMRAFWITLGETIAQTVPEAFALVCLAWSVGYVLGSVSRQTFLINGVLFSATLLIAELEVVPQYLQLQRQLLQDSLGLRPLSHSHDHDAIVALLIYRVLFPLFVQLFLVILPAFWGMWSAFTSSALPLVLRGLISGPALLGMTTLAAAQIVLWIDITTRSHSGPLHTPIGQMPPFILPLAGPVFYIASTAFERWRLPHRQHRA